MNTIQSLVLQLLKTPFFRICLFVLLVLFTFSSCTNYNLRRAQSEELILKFNQGSLLVRLKTDDKRINKIGQIKGNAAAQEAKKKLNEENKRIMNAFKETYKFTPVYFFYSEDSGPLRKKQFDKVRFFDAEGSSVSTPELGFYMVGHMGRVHDRVLTVMREGEEEPRMAGGTGGVQGFIIMTDEYVELNDYHRFGQYWGFKNITPINGMLETRLMDAQRRTYKRERFLAKYNERQARKKSNKGAATEGN